MPLAFPALMTLLAVLWFFYTTFHVARAHAKYKIYAPIMTGDPALEREKDFLALSAVEIHPVEAVTQGDHPQVPKRVAHLSFPAVPPVHELAPLAAHGITELEIVGPKKLGTDEEGRARRRRVEKIGAEAGEGADLKIE